MRSSGRLLDAWRERNVAVGFVLTSFFITSVTTFRPAAFSCCRYAVRSHSYQRAVVELFTSVTAASTVVPDGGLLFQVMPVSVQVVLAAPNACVRTTVEVVDVRLPNSRSRADVTVASAVVSNLR